MLSYSRVTFFTQFAFFCFIYISVECSFCCLIKSTINRVDPPVSRNAFLKKCLLGTRINFLARQHKRTIEIITKSNTVKYMTPSNMKFIIQTKGNLFECNQYLSKYYLSTYQSFSLGPYGTQRPCLCVILIIFNRLLIAAPLTFNFSPNPLSVWVGSCSSNAFKSSFSNFFG